MAALLFPRSACIMQRTACASLLALVCLSLFGCASLPNTKRDPRDPFERMNRATYRFNDTIDRAVAKPVAQTYRRVTPHFVQTGVSNFLDNLGYPTTIVNDLLQLKLQGFCRDTTRLIVNSTVGIGGLFDPATTAGLEKNDEDFGQTLGWWGVRPGPYLVIPFLGPADVRDAFGRGADIFTDPRHYIHDTATSYGLWGLGLLDGRARLLDAEKAMEGVYDPYAFIRNAYLQRRQFLVTDGKVTDEQQKQEEEQYQEEQRILQESEGAAQPNTNAPPSPPQPPPQPPKP